MNSNEKINAVMIIEVLGRPPEYLKEAMNQIITNMKSEKGVVIRNTKINEPVELKEQKEFYSSFAEIEIDAENMLYLVILMFKYMPAHIEIISPQNVAITNADWGDILSELVRRLHGYEEIARIMQAEKGILEKKLRELITPKEEVKETKKEKKSSKKK